MPTVADHLAQARYRAGKVEVGPCVGVNPPTLDLVYHVRAPAIASRRQFAGTVRTADGLLRYPAGPADRAVRQPSALMSYSPAAFAAETPGAALGPVTTFRVSSTLFPPRRTSLYHSSSVSVTLGSGFLQVLLCH